MFSAYWARSCRMDWPREARAVAPGVRFAISGPPLNGPTAFCQPDTGSVKGTIIHLYFAKPRQYLVASVRLQGSFLFLIPSYVYKCRSPFFTAKAPTVFNVLTGLVTERSPSPLPKWLLAIRLMIAAKKGVAAHQIHHAALPAKAHRSCATIFLKLPGRSGRHSLCLLARQNVCPASLSPSQRSSAPTSIGCYRVSRRQCNKPDGDGLDEQCAYPGLL